jgi:hypothetical protein
MIRKKRERFNALTLLTVLGILTWGDTLHEEKASQITDFRP